MKRFLCAATAALISTAAFLPLSASADVIRVAPPAPRHEAVPAPRHGQEWVPGYWNWNGHRYMWMSGHWERARPGFTYRHPEWHQGAHGWELDRGGWGH